jgi:hypothetical protein
VGARKELQPTARPQTERAPRADKEAAKNEVAKKE